MSTNFLDWINQFKLNSIPLIHAGAHFAEERFEYSESKFEPVYWIEALPEVARICEENLVSFPKQHLVNFPVSEKDGEESVFYIAGAEDSSSSLLKPFLISASHPEVQSNRSLVLKTRSLDSLLAEGHFGDQPRYGLVLDLQGAEDKAIYGATQLLSKVDFIIAEVSVRSLYKNSIKFNDLINILDVRGFEVLRGEINRTTGWGEALFINRMGQYAEVLKSSKKNIDYSGSFSFGTSIRTILTRAKFPTGLVRKFKR